MERDNDDGPSDPHTMPLDDDDDARYLERTDPRRLEVEAKRGRRFTRHEEGGDE